MAAKAKAARRQEEYKTILLSMLKEPENKICGDCAAKGPRWASWNIGVFICIRCAGIHRNLGVHISKVKSVNLDTWTEEQIESISAKGNGVVNDFYEHNKPETMARPIDDYSAETFIRAKYEQKKFAPRNKSSDPAERPKEKRERQKSRESPVPVKKAPVVKPVAQAPRQPRPQVKAPAPVKQPAPVSKPQPDLLGPASPLPAQAQAQAAKPNPDLLFMDESQQGGGGGSPAVASVQQKDSIMSLYGTPQQQQQQQQYPGFVSGQQMMTGQMGYVANPVSVYTPQQLQYQQMQQQQFIQAQQVQQQMARLRLGQQSQQGSLVGNSGWPSPVQQRNVTGHTMSNQLWQ